MSTAMLTPMAITMFTVTMAITMFTVTVTAAMPTVTVSVSAYSLRLSLLHEWVMLGGKADEPIDRNDAKRGQKQSGQNNDRVQQRTWNSAALPKASVKTVKLLVLDAEIPKKGKTHTVLPKAKLQHGFQDGGVIAPKCRFESFQKIAVLVGLQFHKFVLNYKN